MQIKTKYDLGQVVFIERVIKRGSGKVSKETHVGIITKIVVDETSHHYVLRSSYTGAVPEEWILCVLTETKAELLDEIADAVGSTEEEDNDDHCWDAQTAASVIDAVRYILEKAGIEIPVVGLAR